MTLVRVADIDPTIVKVCPVWSIACLLRVIELYIFLHSS